MLETYLTFAPVGIKSFIKAMPLWIKEKLWMKELIKDELGYTKVKLFFLNITNLTLHLHFFLHHYNRSCNFNDGWSW
ncbi:MAG: hypothetical protein MZV64_01425 [Ignavibacteriales bacterium]|nr:hypothetical protein [Ignavibacteriales bacterium]